MEKVVRFIVKYHVFFAALFIALAIAGAFLSGSVKQNYDLTKYLPEGTDTTQGLKVMKDEFGLSNNVLVMVDVPQSEIEQTRAKLAEVEGVQLVTLNDYDGVSALFLVTLRGDEYSDTAKNALRGIENQLSDKNYSVSGGVSSSVVLENALATEIPIIMIIAVVVVLIVLTITSHSWIEPLVLVISLFCGVFINMGSNIIFGEISYITFAVAAILQLALSLDYSIILLHAYSDFKSQGESKKEALVKALMQSLRPISGSGLTTIAGLVALFFMSFKIGFDIGIVLAKGIFISLLCVFCFMPSLILLFSRLFDKTAHKPLPLGGDAIAKFSLKAKNILPLVMVAVIICAFVLQNGNEYSFGGWDKTDASEEIAARFGNVNQAVLIIDDRHAQNKTAQSEFAKAVALIKCEDDTDAIKSVTSWGTLELTQNDLTGAFGGSEDEIKPYLNAFIGEEPTLGKINELWQSANRNIYNVRLTQEFIAALLGEEEQSRMVTLVYGMLKEDGNVTIGSALAKVEALKNNPLVGDAISQKIPQSALDVVQFLNENRSLVTQAVDGVLTPLLSDALETYGDVSVYQIEFDGGDTLSDVCKILFSAETFKVGEFYDMWLSSGENLMDFVITEKMVSSMIGIPLPDEIIKIFLSVISQDGEVTVEDLLKFIYENKERVVIKEVLGEPAISLCTLAYLARDIYVPAVNDYVSSLLASLKANFVGKEHGRIVLIMNLPKDGQATYSALNTIKAYANKYFGEDNYLAGESMTLKDVSDTFKSDIVLINVLTAVSIFVIIALLFRSLLLPLVLVLVIQGAIWITMATQALFSLPIFFMSYVICLCIQMGATIDYGILVASNYRRVRETMNKTDAVIYAVRSAMPTVVTSGTIMVAAGFIIGFVSTVMPIYSIGRLLGLGTIISITLILTLLPALLHIFDKPISATTWDGVTPLNEKES